MQCAMSNKNYNNSNKDNFFFKIKEIILAATIYHKILIKLYICSSSLVINIL